MSAYILDFLNILTGLRKTVVMLLVMVISTWLIVRGYLNGQNYTELLKTVVIGFFGANSVEHFSSMVQAHLQGKLPQSSNAAVQAVENVIVGGKEEG